MTQSLSTYGWIESASGGGNDIIYSKTTDLEGLLMQTRCPWCRDRTKGMFTYESKCFYLPASVPLSSHFSTNYVVWQTLRYDATLLTTQLQVSVADKRLKCLQYICVFDFAWVASGGVEIIQQRLLTHVAHVSLMLVTAVSARVRQLLNPVFSRFSHSAMLCSSRLIC